MGLRIYKVECLECHKVFEAKAKNLWELAQDLRLKQHCTIGEHVVPVSMWQSSVVLASEEIKESN